MPRPTEPRLADGTQDWFLREWMAHLRVKQTTLADRIGVPKSTVNALYHGQNAPDHGDEAAAKGRTRYYRRVVNDIAAALGIEPYELLMPPAKALAIREMVAAAGRMHAAIAAPSPPQCGPVIEGPETWEGVTPAGALDWAVKLAGSQARLAEICGCTQGAISQRLKSADPRMSHRFVVIASKRLGIPRWALRPDLYPHESK